MLRKPFRVPFAAPRPQDGADAAGAPPAKRLKLSPDDAAERSTQTHAYSRPSSGFRMPSQVGRDASLETRPQSSVIKQDHPSSSAPDEEYFTALWRKPTNKKHKVWDGDGMIAVRDGLVTLFDESGKPAGRTKATRPLSPGTMISIGGKEVEIDAPLTKDQFRASRPLSDTSSKPPGVRELDAQLCTSVKFNSSPAFLPDKGGTVVNAPVKPFIAPLAKVKSATASFKSPLLDQSDSARPIDASLDRGEPVPRFDPKAPNAVVMTRPKDIPRGKRVVDVVVDPSVSKHLRDHQKEGVKFMYECVMGIRAYGGMGAILADQMGLGKSLQVIALLWTLMKQNPIFEDSPIVKKAVIICPATVVRNWKKEFRKWLGEKVGVLVVDDKKSRLRDFTHGKAYNVMVIGYERFRSVQEDLEKGAGVDIVVADEGHRLKTAKNKAGQALKSLSTDRRVILTGTPLQNDLSELYFVSDIVNPGLLGKPSAFKKEFELPIARSTDPDASPQEVQKGQARSAELAEMTSLYILRRTMEILADYLPPKTETIVFCKPTAAQAEVYRSILGSPIFGSVLGNTETALQFISVLKKVCNSPNLLRNKNDNEEAKKNEVIAQLLADMPPKLLKFPGASAKLQVLDSLLHVLSTTTEEKIVIVSHYTSTLDLVGNLISSMQLDYLRLDGSTPNGKRQGLIDRFNRLPASKCFAFLLSAKSGGAGINLIGASRLVLFDIDWNPSTEDQAMARIHRDGQKRHCRIYRLLVHGALDEKIYQRQLTKRALADSVVDGKHSATTNFSREELRKLFSLDESDACQTHELLDCHCAGDGQLPRPSGADDTTDVPPGADATPNSSDDSDGSDEEIPPLGEMMSASHAMRLSAQSARRASPTKTQQAQQRAPADIEMQSLMQYRHIDPAQLAGDGSAASGAALDGDEVLGRVLCESEVKIGYLFSRTFARAVEVVADADAVDGDE